MGLRYPDQKYCQWFFVTSTFREWRCLGDLPGFYGQLANSVEFCAKKYEARLSGYVLMPSHVHFLVTIDGSRLGNFMRDFKKFVAQKIASTYGLKGSLWMPRYDRVAIVSEDVFRTKLGYIHANPVRDKLVNLEDDWYWSSAADYTCKRNGPISVFKNWI